MKKRTLFFGFSIFLLAAPLFSTTVLAQESTGISVEQAQTSETNSTSESSSSEKNNSEWEKALAAGYTIEQFNAIMAIPDIPATPAARSTAAMTANQSKIVAEAKKHLGKPYAWGGAGPSSFDCSGLVQYVFKHGANITLPRVTTQQEKQGTEASLNSLKPGDLLFWGNRGATYHVAIYIGNNQYIHSPQPGEKVVIRSLSYWRPQFARRILKDETPIKTTQSYLGSINSNNVKLWSDLELTKAKSSTTIGKVYRVKLLYTYSSGKRVFSVYNSNDTWAGYVDANYMTPLKITSFKQQVVLKKKGYYSYKNFFFSGTNFKTDNHLGKTFEVGGYYTLGNGDRYYSLYNKSGKWFGYIKADAVLTVKYQSLNKYLTITKENQTIWDNLALSKSNGTTTGKHGKVYYTKGYSLLSDGSKFYALYNQNGTWAGHVAASNLAEVKKTSFNKKVVIKQKNYYSYDNIYITKKRWKSDNYIGKTFIARDYYTLRNKKRYYSLYDSNGKYHGCINVAATNITP